MTPPPAIPRPFRLRAVLFDFDGTLTLPGALDFDAVKDEVGCPRDRLLLEWIEEQPRGARRDAALAALERLELDGARRSRPNAHAQEVVRELQRLGVSLGIITRNGRAAVETALRRFDRLDVTAFATVLTRDDPVRPKPAPDGVLLAARHMGVPPHEVLMVGDYLLDVEAGRNAGAVTLFLTNGDEHSRPEPDEEIAGERAARGAAAPEAGAAAWAHSKGGVDVCDFVVHDLREVLPIVRLGLPLPQGKLPNELLAGFLDGLTVTDPAVLVGAGVGEDVAALDLADAELLAVHGDPITLAGTQLGRYAVQVNLNDIATCGAEPRWMLVTVLLPATTTAAEALHLLRELADAAAADGVSLIGGHTEVTGVVTRPVVSATVLGTVRRADLRDKRAVVTGDRLLLTKGLAVEGTALLATELAARLAGLGMTEAELAACRALLQGIGVLPEARIACAHTGVHALHDVTEGGLATALRELAVATGHDLIVRLHAVPVLPLTRRLCELLHADPLGLIASGSLLICCAATDHDDLVAALRRAGIAVADIGEVAGAAGEGGAAVTAVEHGRPAVLPSFTRDEAARVLEVEGG